MTPYKIKKRQCILCPNSEDLISHFRERVHKRRLKEVVKEFSLMCRGMHGTAYAAATY